MDCVEISVGLAGSAKTKTRFAFRTRLPFRIRVPKIYSFQAPGSQHQIYIRNEFAVPDVAEFDLLKPPITDSVTLFSDLMVIIDPANSSIVPPKTNAAPPSTMPIPRWKIRQMIDSQARPYAELAAAVFNDFIVAFEIVAWHPKLTFFGAVRSYRLISSMAFTTSDSKITKIVSPKNYTLGDADIESLMSTNPVRSRGDYVMRPVEDVSDELLATVGNTFEKTQKEIFYHFEFEANSARYGGDSIRHLLMSCIALESAHASLLRERYKRKNPKANAESAIKEFLAKAGISKTLEITTALIMDESERPPRELLAAVAKAITARNSIVHANRSKGKYSARSYLPSQIARHALDVMEALQYYKRAIEKDSAPLQPDLSKS